MIYTENQLAGIAAQCRILADKYPDDTKASLLYSALYRALPDSSILAERTEISHMIPDREYRAWFRNVEIAASKGLSFAGCIAYADSWQGNYRGR